MGTCSFTSKLIGTTSNSWKMKDRGLRSHFFVFCMWMIFQIMNFTDAKPSLKCKNPSGKLWSSILNDDCGQSVCRKIGKKARWTKCQNAVTEENLEKILEIH